MPTNVWLIWKKVKNPLSYLYCQQNANTCTMVYKINNFLFHFDRLDGTKASPQSSCRFQMSNEKTGENRRFRSPGIVGNISIISVFTPTFLVLFLGIISSD